MFFDEYIINTKILQIFVLTEWVLNIRYNLSSNLPISHLRPPSLFSILRQRYKLTCRIKEIRRSTSGRGGFPERDTLCRHSGRGVITELDHVEPEEETPGVHLGSLGRVGL